MNRVGIFILASAAVMLASVGSGYAIDIVPPPMPKPSGQVIVVRETITLDRKNTVYDYEGATLVWKGEGDCSQKEDMPPIFRIVASGITVKNATIRNAPDGIHVSAARTTIEGINFPDVCEDAITMKEGARWARITNCYFAKAADKAIQCTHGNGHRVYDNVFVDVKVAFRSKPGVNASFYRNKLYRCASGVRADGRGSNSKVWGNEFVFVKYPYQPLDKAVIRELGKDVQVKQRR